MYICLAQFCLLFVSIFKASQDKSILWNCCYVFNYFFLVHVTARHKSIVLIWNLYWLYFRIKKRKTRYELSIISVYHLKKLYTVVSRYIALPLYRHPRLSPWNCQERISPHVNSPVIMPPPHIAIRHWFWETFSPII